MKRTILSAVAVFALTTSAMAANNQTGCGLGSQVIKSPDSAILYAPVFIAKRF